MFRTATQEKAFVKEVKGVGIKNYGCMYGEGRARKNLYWFFELSNGQHRYWTNLSDESMKILEVGYGDKEKL